MSTIPHVAVFQKKEIRKIIYKNEWWFSVADVIEVLTAEISKATFGLIPSQYKKLKNLKHQNLRDHMNDLELIFSMLGERVTTEISQQEKPDTFNKNKFVAKRGGNIAGNARKQTEKELGRPVVTSDNYLSMPEIIKKLN